MKKFITIVATTLLIISMFCGCDHSSSESEDFNVNQWTAQWVANPLNPASPLHPMLP